MSVFVNRISNLKLLVKQHGGQVRLSNKLGFSRGWLSQLIGKTTHRDVTEKTARSIEAALGIELGWLDREHIPLPKTSEPRLLTLSQALDTLAVQADADPALPMSIDKFANLCGLLLERTRTHNGVDEGYLGRLMKLAR